MEQVAINRGAKRHFENLDALRFLAFLAVFTLHVLNIPAPVIFSHPWHQWILSFTFLGFLGVDFFFVLSSFLITWIILEEYEHTGEFALGKFYIRRTLRIWPLYFVIVFSLYATAWFGTDFTGKLPDFIWALTFTLNLYVVEHGHQFLLALGVLWSISVEEQFYLGWALVLKKLQKHLPQVAIMLIAISLISCVYFRDRIDYASFFTTVFLQHFGIGALLAWAAFNRTKMFRLMENIPGKWILSAYLAGVVILAAYRHVAWSSTLAMVPLRFGLVVFFGFVIFEQSFCKNSLFKLGGWKPLDYLGKISYGLYVYHGVAICLAIYLTYPNGAGDTLLEAVVYYPVAILMLTVVLSAVSYQFFEKPFLQLKSRFYNDWTPATSP